MRVLLWSCAILALVVLSAQEAGGQVLGINVEEAAEDSAGVMQGGRLNFKNSRRRSGYNFFKDKSWSMSNDDKSTSWGQLGRRVGQLRRRRTANMKDFVFSSNSRSSAESIMSWSNAKRVSEGRSPTKYLEEGVERGRDKPKRRRMLNPSFRFMRGPFRGRSEESILKKEENDRAVAEYDKIAGINPKTGKYQEDDDDDEIYDGGLTMDED